MTASLEPLKRETITEKRKGRKALGLEHIFTLIIGVVIVIAVLLLLFGGPLKIAQKLGLTIPDEALKDLQKGYIVSACTTWLDSGGLEVSYTPEIYDAIKAGNLEWDEFCSPDAIKDPQKRCTCVKACTKAITADKTCKINPNTYKPDLFTPYPEDPEMGIVKTATDVRENVSVNLAMPYCVMDFLATLKDIDRTCRPESEAGDIITVNTQLAYTKNPVSGYSTFKVYDAVLDTDSGKTAPNIQEIKVTCLATCRVLEGCTDISLSVNYGCTSFRRKPGDTNNRFHCCERSIMEFPGSRLLVPDKSIPVANSMCLDPGRDCPQNPETPAQSLTFPNTVKWHLGGDEAVNFEKIRFDGTAQSCGPLDDGETCTKEFIIKAAPETFNHNIGPSLMGVSALENYAMVCKGNYQGDTIYSENQPILTALTSSGAFTEGAGGVLSIHVQKVFLCLNEDDYCREISASHDGSGRGEPYDMNGEAIPACTQ